MSIRYMMLDNGVDFEEEVVSPDTWGALKPKTVCMQNRHFSDLIHLK